MATADEYASWIVKNQSLKGTPQFDTVAKAYQEAKAEETVSAGQQGIEGNKVSVLTGEPLREEAGTGRKLAQSALKGVAGFGDLVVGGPENYRRGYEYFTTPDMPTPRMAAPIQTYLKEKGIITPEAEFNTPVGRVADFTTQLATTGGIRPQNIVNAGKSLMSSSSLKPIDSFARLGKNVGFTGTTGVLGGSTLEGVKSIGVDNAYVQMIAPSLVMALGGSAIASRGTPSTIVNDAIKGMNPQQLQAADALVKLSYSKGAPITGAEAIAQVMGGNRLTSTQRFVEQQPQGNSAQVMADFLRKRPEGNRNMFEVTVGGVSPFSSFDEAPVKLQQTAEKTVKEAKSFRTKATEPYYKQTEKNLIVLDSDVKGLIGGPSGDAIADAINHVITDPYSGAKGLKQNDPKTLIAAKKYLDAQYKNFSNTFGNTFDDTKAGFAYGGSRQLDDFLAQKSPSYAEGRTGYQQLSQDVVKPLESGRVGQLGKPLESSEQGIRAQSDILMPKSPRATSPDDIRRTVEILRKQDPVVVQDWTRQNLKGIFDETTKDLTGGQNQFGGSKFAVTVAGNKQQRDNLRALVTSSSGMQAWKGFEDMLDVLQAQGQRLPANSATSFNVMAAQQMGEGGMGALPATVSQPSKIAKLYESWRIGNNSEMLARILTDPNTIKKLEELAKTKPNSLKAQTIVNSIAGGYIGQKPEITEEKQ
jgi:hypothetical protein